MLRPIPRQLLTGTEIIKVCIGVDAWQKPAWELHPVRNVHLQNTNEVKKSKDNTEIVLRSVLFIDGIQSTPRLDYDTLMKQSEASGKPLSVEVVNAAGTNVGEYEVITCDSVPDVPATRIHHIELGLV